MKNINLLLFAFVLGLTSCSLDDDPPQPVVNQGFGNGFYVVNQGNFTAGNSSLSFYNTDSLKMTNNLFYQVNGAPLGDVAQSMFFRDKLAYVVVNNSGIIYVVEASTCKYLGKVTGLTSPRNLLFIDHQKAYVSDFLDKNITVINPATLQILGTIPTQKSTEAMVMVGTTVFASNWSSYNQTGSNNTLQVFDAEVDRLVDSVEVVKEPNSMVVDKNNKVWVLCSGGYMSEEIPALHRIDPQSLAIEKTYHFNSIDLSPDHLCINGTGDTLYFLNNGIYRMGIQDDQLPEVPFVKAGMHYFYTLAVDPTNSQMVATDAGNYVQNGWVYRFSASGAALDSVQAGIIPGFIGFKP